MTLAKDCSCTDHNGPHWLYEIWVAERENLAALQIAIDAGDDIGVAAGKYFFAEFRRKNEMIYQARLRGIEAIPPELIPPPPPRLRYPCDEQGRPHPIIEELARLMGWSIPVQQPLF